MTEKEKDAYIAQLQSDVAKWHRAYDALINERNRFASEIQELKNQVLKLGNQLAETSFGIMTKKPLES